MKETIIANWNGRVAKNDEVYILGDMFWYNEEAPEILSQLKGKKYLIRGNHDRINAEMEKYFEWSDKYIHNLKDGNDRLVLCHFPIAHWDGQFYTPPIIHLYGHIHQGRDTRPFEQYASMWEKEWGTPFMAANVGCMLPYMNYTPRILKEIKKAKGWI